MTKQVFERKVLKGFTDKNTKKQYPKGSVYKSDDKERVNELVKKKNLSGKAVKTMAKAVEDATPKNEVETADTLKYVGGGNYELPNGERVKGKENAEKALAEAGE